MGYMKNLNIEKMNNNANLCYDYDWVFTGSRHIYDFILTSRPKQVIFNPPTTVVIWEDGSKTLVRAHNEEFDPEKGFAMAIAKKLLGRMEFERMMNAGLESLKNKQKKEMKGQ